MCLTCFLLADFQYRQIEIQPIVESHTSVGSRSKIVKNLDIHSWHRHARSRSLSVCCAAWLSKFARQLVLGWALQWPRMHEPDVLRIALGSDRIFGQHPAINVMRRERERHLVRVLHYAIALSQLCRLISSALAR